MTFRVSEPSADHLRGLVTEVGAMLTDGRVRAHETVVDGIEGVVDAFTGLLSGDNTGKMVVRLA